MPPSPCDPMDSQPPFRVNGSVTPHQPGHGSNTNPNPDPVFALGDDPWVQWAALRDRYHRATPNLWIPVMLVSLSTHTLALIGWIYGLPLVVGSPASVTISTPLPLEFVDLPPSATPERPPSDTDRIATVDRGGGAVQNPQLPVGESLAPSLDIAGAHFEPDFEPDFEPLLDQPVDPLPDLGLRGESQGRSSDALDWENPEPQGDGSRDSASSQDWTPSTDSPSPEGGLAYPNPAAQPQPPEPQAPTPRSRRVQPPQPDAPSPNRDSRPLTAATWASASGWSNNDRPGQGSGVAARAQVDWGPYTAELQHKVEALWTPALGGASEVEVAFTIYRSGVVGNVRVTQSSGDPQVDRQAIRAVAQANPFAPLPLNYPQDAVEVSFTFTVNVVDATLRSSVE